MRDIIITLIIFGSIPFVFKRPWTGILLFSWISYMNPHRLTYGFAFSFQFALIAAVVTIIAFVIDRDPKKIPLTPISVLLFIFIAWTAVTTIAALAPEPATARFIEFVKIQLMTVLTLAMVNNRYRLNWLIVMIVFSIGFYGVRGGIFSIMTGGNYRVWGPPGSFFQDNNQLALTLIMTMPLMHYLQLIATKRWVRHMMSVVILLTLGAIIGTYSRGALLALSAMGAVLWLRSTKKLPVAFAAAICIAGFCRSCRRNGSTAWIRSTHTRRMNLLPAGLTPGYFQSISQATVYSGAGSKPTQIWNCGPSTTRIPRSTGRRTASISKYWANTAISGLSFSF